MRSPKVSRALKIALVGLLVMVTGFGLGFFDKAVGVSIMAVGWVVIAYAWVLHRRAAGGTEKR